MRRKDREMTDIDEIINVVKKCKVCRLALSENDFPYIVPLNYGYSFENNTLTFFFHSALEGKKMDIIKNNNNACFQLDCDNALVEADIACKHGYAFKSVVGFGKIIFLESETEKNEALNLIMKHQTGKDTVYNFTSAETKNICVYKMLVETFSGKQRNLPER